MSTWISFVERFGAVVSRVGDRPAVVVGALTTFTYRELWDLSGCVAHGLRLAGVGLESVVGIRLERSYEFLATMIGVWRARAAYLPLNAETPSDRLRFMVHDAGASLVIVRDRVAAGVAWPEIPAVAFDQLVGHGPLPSGSDPVRPVPADLAWVIYTSGTTGHPRRGRGTTRLRPASGSPAGGV